MLLGQVKLALPAHGDGVAEQRESILSWARKGEGHSRLRLSPHQPGKAPVVGRAESGEAERVKAAVVVEPSQGRALYTKKRIGLHPAGNGGTRPGVSGKVPPLPALLPPGERGWVQVTRSYWVQVTQ